jgi:hypothetical protein
MADNQTIDYSSYMKYLDNLKSEITNLESQLHHYINKINNNLIDDELLIVGNIIPIGNSDINGIFTVMKDNSKFILKKTVIENLESKIYIYTGQNIDNDIIFYDNNNNAMYKMNSNYSIKFKHKIDTPEITTKNLEIAGELKALGNANMNGIFTVSRDINGNADLILKKITQTNDGNVIKLFNGKINGAKIIFTDNNNNSVYIMGTPKSLIISHKLEVPSIHIGNTKQNVNGNVLSLYSGSKDGALIDFLDNAGGRNTFIQGNKNELYTPSTIKTDKDIISNKIFVNEIHLKDPKKGSYITQIKDEVPKDCRDNEYVCGMGANYYGNTVIGTYFKCCKFDKRDD